MSENAKVNLFMFLCILLMGDNIAMSATALTAAAMYMRAKRDAVLAEDNAALVDCGQAGKDAMRYSRRLYGLCFAMMCFAAGTSWLMVLAKAMQA